MNRDTTRDQNVEENGTFDGECLDLPNILLPETDNVLYSILNSLNQNIADFYTFAKFNSYLSEDHLNVELLKEKHGHSQGLYSTVPSYQRRSCIYLPRIYGKNGKDIV